MNPSTLRKVWGDIWGRKSRTLLVSISIFIGVLGVVTLITAGDLLVRQLKADIQEAELPMLESVITIPPNEDATAVDNDALLATLQADLPGITRIEGRANQPFFWKYQDENRFREAVLLAYLGGFEDKSLEPMRLVEGRYPAAGQQELVIEQRMSEDYDLGVGDTIDLRILGSEADTLPTESWTITGVVFHAYNVQPNLSMYAAFEDVSRVSGAAGLTGISARFTDFEAAQAAQDGFRAAIMENSPYAVVFVSASDPARNNFIENTQQYANIMAALAVVAMLVSGFLVLNVINNLVVEQRKQIGVMKSLGTTRGEMFLIYSSIALAYGIFGMVPGVLAGIPLGYQMAVIVGDFANTLIDGFALSPLAIILGVSLGLAVPVGSALVPVLNGTRVTILDAMTDLGIAGNYRVGVLNRLVRMLPLPLSIKQSLNNITQKKWRLTLTVVTLTLAVAAFMGVSAVFVRLSDVLTNILATFEYQIIVQTTEPQDIEQIEALVRDSIGDVDLVSPGSTSIVQLEGYIFERSQSNQILIQGIDTAMVFEDIEYADGDAWKNDPEREGIVLTNEITTQMGKDVGDMVQITALGNTAEYEIIGVLNYPFPVGLMRWQTIAQLTGYTKGAPTPDQYFTTLALDDYTGTLPAGQVTAWGMGEQTAAYLPRVAGEAIQPGQVMISSALAEGGGYDLGDTLTLGAGDQTAEYTVGAIFDLLPQMSAAGIAPDLVAFVWTDLAALEGVSLEGEPVSNAFYILLDADDPSVRAVDETIELLDQQMVASGITGSYTNMVELSEQVSDGILSIGLVLNMASAIMAAVGAIGLLTTLSIAVFERQKEIGVMRSVGAGAPTIVLQFLVEGLLVGVLAWLLAAPLSYGLAYGLTAILPFGDFIEFSYPPIMLPLGFAGVFVIAAAASIWPSLTAARKTVSDILRYQ